MVVMDLPQNIAWIYMLLLKKNDSVQTCRRDLFVFQVLKCCLKLRMMLWCNWRRHVTQCNFFFIVRMFSFHNDSSISLFFFFFFFVNFNSFCDEWIFQKICLKKKYVSKICARDFFYIISWRLFKYIVRTYLRIE